MSEFTKEYKEVASELLGCTLTTYYNWNKQNRPIINFIEKYLSISDIQSFLSNSTVPKLELLEQHTSSISSLYHSFFYDNIDTYSDLVRYFNLIKYLVNNKKEFIVNQVELHYKLYQNNIFEYYKTNDNVDSDLLTTFLSIDKTLLYFILSSYTNGFEFFYDIINKPEWENGMTGDVNLLKHEIYRAASLKSLDLNNLEFYIRNSTNKIEYLVETTKTYKEYYEQNIDESTYNVHLQIIKDITNDKITNDLLENEKITYKQIIINTFFNVLKNKNLIFDITYDSKNFTISYELIKDFAKVYGYKIKDLPNNPDILDEYMNTVEGKLILKDIMKFSISDIFK